MIDTIINAVVDSASPAITRCRTAFLVISLVFLSPELDKLLAIDIFSVSLIQSASLFGDLLASSKAVVALGVALCFYIIAPYINYGMLLLFTKKSLSSAQPLLDKLEEIRAKKKDEIEKIIEESFDFHEDKAKSSSERIDRYRQRTEITMMSFVMYMISSLHLEVFNIYFGLAILAFYLVICYWVARNVLLIYIRDVATFKVLQDYVKYFVLVK